MAQNKPIVSLQFNKLYHVGINPAGELFALSKEKINRFDKDGKVTHEIKFTKANEVTQFDAWHLTQLVLYYRATQTVEIYNPILDLRNSFVIDSVFAIEPEWIAASFDQQHFWIFDKADKSIKKVNYKTQEVIIDEAVLAFDNQELVIGMREYQRFLFIRTTGALHVFSAMGRHIKEINIMPEQSFDFFGEELVILKGDKLNMSSLFTEDNREVSAFSVFTKVFLTDERLFGIKKDSVEIFLFNPQ
ncbi:hypothetical protein SanaruYs_19340 [Chryseotalea sanaruensis]|uniref:WD40 repeat domain-containing protein n=1 Tax=Chryseotalea sanaruensis TaxID=2482724 RepID=A0A401U9Z3_9BACT|nr:hypothetical protein SanaruYs_19340 [Chryseotalea sanaruensis]